MYLYLCIAFAPLFILILIYRWAFFFINVRHRLSIMLTVTIGQVCYKYPLNVLTVYSSSLNIHKHPKVERKIEALVTFAV